MSWNSTTSSMYTGKKNCSSTPGSLYFYHPTKTFVCNHCEDSGIEFTCTPAHVGIIQLACRKCRPQQHEIDKKTDEMKEKIKKMNILYKEKGWGGYNL